jgi:hypothetical protein
MGDMGRLAEWQQWVVSPVGRRWKLPLDSDPLVTASFIKVWQLCQCSGRPPGRTLNGRSRRPLPFGLQSPVTESSLEPTLR